jgi:ribosomal protein L7/L12
VDYTAILIIVIALSGVFGSVWWMLYRCWGPFPARTKRPPLPPLVVPDNSMQTRRELAQSNKIRAINVIRERTGMGQQAASDYIESLSNGTALALLSVEAWVPSNTLQFVVEANRLLEQGNRVQAIKRVRELTGMSLKEAKVYVDAL